MRSRLAISAGATLIGLGAALAQVTGPSTATPPYLLPNPALPPGAVKTVSILTAGDSVGGYRLVGVPDGIGAFIDDGPMQFLVNHELTRSEGIVRAHGATGSFVSRYAIDPITLAVVAGRDHNTGPLDVKTFDKASLLWVAGADAFERFCSGDLAPQSAFFYRGFGTSRRIYLNGEETRPPSTSDFGRIFAHIATGPDRNETWELPALGRISVENALASPFPQRKTIVIGMDDGDVGTTATTAAPSEIYLYAGQKSRKGANDIENAGLTGGTLHGIQVLVDAAPLGGESDLYGFGSASFLGEARFAPVSLGDVTARTGIQLQADAKAAGVTRFQRTEDGAWDPRPGRQNDFYFVTTATFTTNSRLFRLRFDDITDPSRGGTISILLTGGEGHRMLDNITVDPLGRIVALEDVGNNARLGRVWIYDTNNGSFTEVAAFDADLFLPGAPGFITQDEESSGVIQAFDLLGQGWYLLDAQAHNRLSDPELVEGGQLLAIYIDPALGR